jgi:hypothetical protein
LTTEHRRIDRPGENDPVLGTGKKSEETPMKTLILAAVLSLATTSAFATCKSDSADKKLAGAAANSFMKKCETDAKAKCEADSKEKKLAGAAKASHMKKCVADSVGA